MTPDTPDAPTADDALFDARFDKLLADAARRAEAAKAAKTDRWAGFTADDLLLLAGGCGIACGVALIMRELDRAERLGDLTQELGVAHERAMAREAATEPVGFVPPADPT